jgi:23S rRNA (guanosine2251-2'-O)-methyltransferase
VHDAARAPAPQPAGGEMLRWGTHAVEEALQAGCVRAVWVDAALQRRPRLLRLAALAAERGVPLYLTSRDQLDRWTGGERHQGVVAETAPFRYRSLDELLAIAGERAEPPLLLALDGVEDPHNLGAILRSADAASVHGVIIPRHRAARVTPVVARASAGAVDHLPIAQVVNLTQALRWLKEAGLWVYGLDAAGAVPFDQADYRHGIVLVAGAEGTGLHRLVREQCDELLSIPMHGHVASLNVSVATSLVVFAARQARSRAQGQEAGGARGSGETATSGQAAARSTAGANRGRSVASSRTGPGILG